MSHDAWAGHQHTAAVSRVKYAGACGAVAGRGAGHEASARARRAGGSAGRCRSRSPARRRRGRRPRRSTATKIEKVKDNLYIITGSRADDETAFSGGNVAVFITDSGVTLVDSKLPGFGPTLVERVKSVTNKPITRIINTHTHGDHTGSNTFFGASVETVVHENAKVSMAKMDDFKGANAKLLPGRTYKDKLTIGSGRDQIDIYYFGRGHTDGDSFIVFPALRTMHVGDIFAWKALPFIDPDNGGSVVEHPKTLARAAGTVKNVDTLINGHIPVGTVPGPAGVRRLHGRLRRLCRAVAQGRQERRAGGEGIQGRSRVQGLRGERQPDVRGRAAQSGARIQRIEKVGGRLQAARYRRRRSWPHS